MNVNKLDETNTSIVQKVSKPWGGAFLHLPLPKKIKCSFYVYTVEKINTSPLCILCMLMPQIIPLLTLMLVHTWYENPPPGQFKLTSQSSYPLPIHRKNL